MISPQHYSSALNSFIAYRGGTKESLGSFLARKGTNAQTVFLLETAFEQMVEPNHLGVAIWLFEYRSIATKAYAVDHAVQNKCHCMAELFLKNSLSKASPRFKRITEAVILEWDKRSLSKLRPGLSCLSHDIGHWLHSLDGGILDN